MTKETIRVLVVEDHNVVRQGLVALISLVEGVKVVGEAADGAEAIAQFRKHQPDVTLIDLRISDRVTVRLSPAAFQAREEELKDSAKKKKGGSA